MRRILAMIDVKPRPNISESKSSIGPSFEELEERRGIAIKISG